MDLNSETGWVAVVVPFVSLFFKCLRSLETPLDKCQKITLTITKTGLWLRKQKSLAKFLVLSLRFGCDAVLF